MNVLPPISDNITEVLVKIIHFTELRQRTLHRNLRQADRPWFVPLDLPVREFAEALDEAVAEHLRSRRLLFRDRANIEFGPNNAMQIQPVADPHAHALLRTSRDEYVELQVNKLLENTLNRRVAEELLRQKCGTCPAAMHGEVNEAAGDDPAGTLPAHQDRAD